MHKAPEYWAWHAMLQRTGNPNNPRFSEYGGRGIKVCDRWKDFRNFIADMGLRPKGKSLNRVNNDKSYEPGNCIWSTRSEQQVNKKKWKGKRSSKFIGVVYVKADRRWRAEIRGRGRRWSKCGFTSEIEAAKARDQMAFAEYGKLVALNFPITEE